MKKLDHLEVYDLTLEVKSPLFIGSGADIQKFEYILSGNTVSFIDNDKLFALLIKTGKIDAYEKFILSSSSNYNMYAFLKNSCGYTEAQIDSVCRYRVSAGDAMDRDHSLKEIKGFMRNNAGKAYVPGSSIKGAIRTCMLADMILKSGRKGSKEELADRRAVIPEGRYLNTLSNKVDKATGIRKDDPVNSIMRGISVSDSEIIPDSDMILIQKIDVNVEGDGKPLNLVREAVKPGAKIRFRLTLDTSILKGKISAGSILKNIDDFDEFYYNNFIMKFDEVPGEVHVPLKNSLILGGGSGFFSKTLDYEYLSFDDALELVTDIMKSGFRNHKHENDIRKGISPHTLKYTKYKGGLYQMGICEVSIS